MHEGKQLSGALTSLSLTTSADDYYYQTPTSDFLPGVFDNCDMSVGESCTATTKFFCPANVPSHNSTSYTRVDEESIVPYAGSELASYGGNGYC